MVLVTACVAACDALPSDRPTSVVRDSAGVPIVENFARAWEGDEAWVLEPEPVLEIGALVGPPEYELREIHDATRFPSGVVALVEGVAREIRLYDEAGFHLGTVTGAGGRSFTEAPSVRAVGPDTLLVHDPGTDSLFWIGLAGEILRRSGPNAELRKRVEPAVEPTLPDDPFAPAAAVAYHPRSATVAVSHPERWEVRVHDGEGGLTRILRAAAPRTPVTPELLSFVRGQLVETTVDPDEARARLASFDALPRPDSAPAIAELHLDAEGNLWVGRWSETRIPGLEVFDRDGRWLGIVLLPPDFGTILEIGEDRLIARHWDAVGVPYLHVYRLRKEPPGRGG